MNDAAMDPSAATIDTELTSPRLRFYLEHQAEIEEWAALRKEVREATSELLAGLLDDLGAVASDLGPDVGARHDGEGTKYPRLMLRRMHWPTNDQEATLGVGVEWTPQVDPGGRQPPYYGVRVDWRVPGGQELLDEIRAVTEASGAFGKPYVFTGRDWPVYRYMDPDQAWWKDLVAWRGRVVDEVVACWHLAAAFVDEVVARQAIPQDKT